MGFEIIGDLFDEYPNLTTAELAERLQSDIADVQDDGLIDARAKTTITSPQPGLLHARISLPEVGIAITNDVVATVIGLATHYQSVDLDHPENARFRLVVGVADAHCGCVKSASSTYGSLYPTRLDRGTDTAGLALIASD